MVKIWSFRQKATITTKFIFSVFCKNIEEHCLFHCITVQSIWNLLTLHTTSRGLIFKFQISLTRWKTDHVTYQGPGQQRGSGVAVYKTFLKIFQNCLESFSYKDPLKLKSKFSVSQKRVSERFYKWSCFSSVPTSSFKNFTTGDVAVLVRVITNCTINLCVFLR